MNIESQNNAKTLVAKYFLNSIELSGIIGLGTGSTAAKVIYLLGQSKLKNQIQAVPTSYTSLEFAKQNQIQVISNFNKIDLSFDGADWVDPKGNCIKGYGGALVKEKIVAEASDMYYILVDESKLTESFDDKLIPVEIIPLALNNVIFEVNNLGGFSQIRTKNQQRVLTDNGNFILDCNFPEISDLEKLAKKLKQITGVVDHGLFLNVVDKLFVGYFTGEVKTFKNGIWI